MVNVGNDIHNKAVRRLSSPPSCGILGYRAVASMAHNIESTEKGKGHVAYLENLACPGCMTECWVRRVQ